MEFSKIIGLGPDSVKPNSSLTSIFVRDCLSEYSPAHSTTGILISNVSVSDAEQKTFDPEKPPEDDGPITQLATAAIPVPAPSPSTHGKKIRPKSPGDFVMFPFANIRYGHEFVCRKTRRLGDIHSSEILITNNPYTLHETAKVVDVKQMDEIEFDLIMPDVRKYGAVAVTTQSADNLMKALVATLRNASRAYKFNCLLKFSTNTDYISSKYGPTTCAVSVIQPKQFLPVFGKDDGCIIHITMINSRGHVMDIVGLAGNEEETLFAIDGVVLYEQSYKNPFTSTTVPHLKKYSKYINAGFGSGGDKKAAQAYKR